MDYPLITEGLFVIIILIYYIHNTKFFDIKGSVFVHSLTAAFCRKIIGWCFIGISLHVPSGGILIVRILVRHQFPFKTRVLRNSFGISVFHAPPR